MTDCPICYEAIINPVSLGCCNNKICFKCMIKIYDTNNHKKLNCALCRTKIIKEEEEIKCIYEDNLIVHNNNLPDYFIRYYDIHNVYPIPWMNIGLLSNFINCSIIYNINILYDIYILSEILQNNYFINKVLLNHVKISIENNKLIIKIGLPNKENIILYELDIICNTDYSEERIIKYVDKIIDRINSVKRLLGGRYFSHNHKLGKSKYLNDSYDLIFEIHKNRLIIKKHEYKNNIDINIKNEGFIINFITAFKDKKYNFYISNDNEFVYFILFKKIRLIKNFIHDYFLKNDLIDTDKYKLYLNMIQYKLTCKNEGDNKFKFMLYNIDTNGLFSPNDLM